MGMDDGERIGRRGRFKTDGKENDLFVRVLPGYINGFERGVQNADIRSVGLGVEQAFLRPRHSQHIAERTEDDPFFLRQINRLVDQV